MIIGRLLDSESLFMDSSLRRKKRQFTVRDDFRPIFFDQLNFTEEQSTFCKGNRECLLNLVVTNDPEIGASVLEEETTSNITVDQLGKL